MNERFQTIRTKANQIIECSYGVLFLSLVLVLSNIRTHLKQRQCNLRVRGTPCFTLN
jgi:hypothetical protein